MSRGNKNKIMLRVIKKVTDLYYFNSCEYKMKASNTSNPNIYEISKWWDFKCYYDKENINEIHKGNI